MPPVPTPPVAPSSEPMLQHHGLITVIHDDSGVSYSPWRRKAGGGKSGEGQLIRPGNMGPPVASAGTYGYEELTVAMALDHGKHSGYVEDFNGKYGDRFTIIDQPVDAKGQAGFHDPVTSGGRLTAITPREYDADGNDPSILELTFVIDSVV